MSKTQLSSSEIQDLINRYHSELKKLEFQVDEVITTIAQLERLLENVSGREKSAISKVKVKKSKSLAVSPSLSLTSAKKGVRGRPRKIKESEKATPGKAVAKKAGTKKAVAKKAAAKKATTKKAVTKKAIAKKAITKKAITKKAAPKKATKKPKKSGYKLSAWDQYVIDSIKQAGQIRITQEIIDFVKTKAEADKLNTNDEEIKNKVTRSLQKLANRRNDIIKVPFKGKGFAYAIPDWYGVKGKLDTKFKR
jgi:hypothetical protein